MIEYIKPSAPHDINIEWAKAFSILDRAHRAKKQIKVYSRNRHYIDRFTAIDRQNKPVILNNWTEHGHLIYFKVNQFEWKNISFDDIEKIEIIGA